ncbi:MAG: hypothetical protein JOZ58_02985 [Acetobacteraceae bacterium]|jgi:hypothetical protein|nr:hypothetical protein [Acetobacteraceae bacterium]MBV8573991.1 hypothetical protein [Acetobacteraceae bacterium]
MSGNQDEPGAQTGKKSTEHKVDKTVEDSFPASDPPSTTPAAGSRKAEQNQNNQKPK